MMRKTTLLLILALSLLVAACGASTGSDDAAVATLVAAALQTSGAPTSAPAASAAPLTGMVEGSVCYPSSGIPPMNVYLQQVGTTNVTIVPIGQNQMSYSAEVGVGSYNAYAWLPDFTIGGSYSQAVACGLDASCSDHSLITFDVTGGQLTGGVNVCDWYGQPGDVPYPPGVSAPSSSNNSGNSGSGGSAQTGSISGSLSFPSEGIPALTVVAWSLSEEGVYYYTTTQAGSSYYQIPNLPIGMYQVVAYSGEFAGGFSYAVPCGLTASCTDHGLVYVEVFAGVDSYGTDPIDWYAPEGAFPSNPFIQN